ncbi:MAG: hypothetical protein PF636_08640 [Actinomycetota bacterium]|nr:hypothetical protein [Actinomycetota bacterium]
MSYQVDTIIEPIASALLYSVPIFLIAAAVLAVIASEASHAKISFLAALIVAAALTFWAGTLIDQNLYGVVATATIVSLTPAIAADNRASRTGSIVASLALMAAELLLVPSANMDDLGSIVPALLLLPPLGAQCVMGVAGIGATLSQRASG